MSRIVMSEQPGRKLVQISDNDFNALPQDITGVPVYFRLTNDGLVQLWPKWRTIEGLDFYPNVWVSP